MFLFPVLIIFIVPLDFIITFVRRIRVSRLWVWQVQFILFPVIFSLIASFDFIFSVVRVIRFDWRWVWQTWIWIRILWYLLVLHFFFAFWRVRCWCLVVWRFRINRSWLQRWYFLFEVFVPTRVESKGGQLLQLFWRSNSLFYFQI